MKRVDWSRAAKIARLLASDRPGEVAAAARKLIQACGDVHALAARLEAGPTSDAIAEVAYEKAARDFGAKPCRYCGTLFVGKMTAKYCSAVCRVSAHRERD